VGVLRLRPNAEQANYLRTFAAIKADEVFAFDVNYREGLITFPSFHTTLAVLRRSPCGRSAGCAGPRCCWPL